MAVIVVMGAAAPAGQSANTINWLSYTDVQKEANEDQKKFFLYFSSQSCGYCRMLEKKTFRDDAIISYLNENYRPVWIRTDKELKLARQFSVTGVPDLRFLTHEGEPIARWPGFIEAKDLINLLKFVHTDSYQTMGYAEFLKKQ
jgi:thioredoxin-related protein